MRSEYVEPTKRLAKVRSILCSPGIIPPHKMLWLLETLTSYKRDFRKIWKGYAGTPLTREQITDVRKGIQRGVIEEQVMLENYVRHHLPKVRIPPLFNFNPDEDFLTDLGWRILYGVEVLIYGYNALGQGRIVYPFNADGSKRQGLGKIKLYVSRAGAPRRDSDDISEFLKVKGWDTGLAVSLSFDTSTNFDTRNVHLYNLGIILRIADKSYVPSKILGRVDAYLCRSVSCYRGNLQCAAYFAPDHISSKLSVFCSDHPYIASFGELSPNDSLEFAFGPLAMYSRLSANVWEALIKEAHAAAVWAEKHPCSAEIFPEFYK